MGTRTSSGAVFAATFFRPTSSAAVIKRSMSQGISSQPVVPLRFFDKFRTIVGISLGLESPSVAWPVTKALLKQKSLSSQEKRCAKLQKSLEDSQRLLEDLRDKVDLEPGIHCEKVKLSSKKRYKYQKRKQARIENAKKMKLANDVQSEGETRVVRFVDVQSSPKVANFP